MKLATYNVNGINVRVDVLLRWLEEAEPDVVCLRELKSLDEKFPRREIERAGYGVIWHGQKSWNGVAILARGEEPRETSRTSRRSRRQPQPQDRSGDRRHCDRMPLSPER